MTTVLRIKGVNFTNQNLPYVRPLMVNGILSALRFSGSIPQKDLLGVDAGLETVGAPSIEAFGVQGNISNGFVTKVNEVASMTLISVFKLNNSAQRGMPIGSFNLGNTSGFSMLLDATSGTQVQFSAQVFALNGGTHQNNTLNANMSPRSDFVERFIFVAVIVNAATNQLGIYIPSVHSQIQFSTPAGSIANRKLDNGSEPNKINILTSVTNIWPANTTDVTVGDALIYGKALTKEEIDQQYEYSKQYYKSVLGDDI